MILVPFGCRTCGTWPRREVLCGMHWDLYPKRLAAVLRLMEE